MVWSARIFCGMSIPIRPGGSRQQDFLLFQPPGGQFILQTVRRGRSWHMKTIFFIEDDPVVVKVYGAKFVREGFHVEVAEDGLIALKMLSTVKPDIVVLDLMMPKLNGVDVLKYIRSTPALKVTPVIILSNAHMTSLAQEAAALGAEKALLKSSCTPSSIAQGHP